MPKYAIIGASSFLASAIAQYFSRDELSLFDRQRGNYSFPDNSFYNGFETAQLLEYEAIYYCAGLGIQPKNLDKEELIYELNTFEPIRMISALLALGYKGKIVTFGSYFEYGNTNSSQAFTEAELISNQNSKPNTYCISKALLTQFVANKLANNCEQLLHFVLPNIYGSGENKNRLFPYIKQSIAQQESMTFSAGTQVRQFVYIGDVAELVTKQKTLEQSGVFNLGTKAKSVKEAILEAIESLDSDYNDYVFTEMNRRDTSMLYLIMDDSKARKQLDWQPNQTIEKEILNYR